MGKKTSPQADAVRARIDAGESIPDIAISMGVSERRIYQIIGPKRSRPTLTSKEREKILVLAAAGVPQREIAKRLGVGRNTVGRIVPPSTVIGPSKGRVSDEDVKYILSRHAAGRESGTIARELQIPTQTVSDIIRRKAGQRA